MMFHQITRATGGQQRKDMDEVLVTVLLLICATVVGILIAHTDSASKQKADVNSAAPETDTGGY